MTGPRFFTWIFCITLAAILFSVTPSAASETKGEASIERISPEETRAKVQAGEALLVCSYDDDKCKGLLLEGAVLKSTFEEKLSSLSKNQEIIFYCG